MDSRIVGWADLAIDIVEVAAVIAVLFVLLRLNRSIDALLQVIRRMDRNTASLTTSARWRQAKLNEAHCRPMGTQAARAPGTSRITWSR